eukprot:bmy_16147T0
MLVELLVFWKEARAEPKFLESTWGKGVKSFENLPKKTKIRLDKSQSELNGSQMKSCIFENVKSWTDVLQFPWVSFTLKLNVKTNLEKQSKLTSFLYLTVEKGFDPIIPIKKIPEEVERFLAQLSEFATTKQIRPGPLRSIVKSLLLVSNGALKKSRTAEQVQADFITLGLSEEKATYFSEKWKQNAPTLARRATGQTLMINQLIDMEWTFGVTSGSSELEKVELVVKKGNQTENLYIELTLSQFYSFLHEMERVRTSMECFS